MQRLTDRVTQVQTTLREQIEHIYVSKLDPVLLWIALNSYLVLAFLIAVFIMTVTFQSEICMMILGKLGQQASDLDSVELGFIGIILTLIYKLDKVHITFK